MKKSIIALAILAAAGLASAQSYSLQNDGRIQNSIATYSSASGDGSSRSVAQGAAGATANGYVTASPIPGGMSATLGGASSTYGNGTAFNISNGNATGTAQTNGWSDARTFGNVSYQTPTQHLNLSGSTDSGMTNPVRNGVDYSVNAGKSQDGYAEGTSKGQFDGHGYVAAMPIAGGVSVTGGVFDSKTSESTSFAGPVTFTGGAPVGQSAASRSANAGTEVTFSGSFADPATR